MMILLFGPPGSGKGTQARLLAGRLGVLAVSTGDIFRHEVRTGTEFGRAVQAIMASGALVGDDLVDRIVLTRIGQPDCAAGFLLDGYPRTVPQARSLSAFVAARNLPPAVLIQLDVPDEEIVRRLAGRQQCPACGRVYNRFSHPPEAAGRCNEDGSELLTRDDDSEAVVRRRLLAYHEQTQPVLAYYGPGVAARIDGMQAPADVTAAVERAVRQLSAKRDS